MNDGIYVEVFAMKNGVRYNARIIDMKEVTMTLTDSLMDGIEKLWINKNTTKTREACDHNWEHELTSYDMENMCSKNFYVCTLCGQTKTEMEEEVY